MSKQPLHLNNEEEWEECLVSMAQDARRSLPGRLAQAREASEREFSIFTLRTPYRGRTSPHSPWHQVKRATVLLAQAQATGEPATLQREDSIYSTGEPLILSGALNHLLAWVREQGYEAAYRQHSNCSFEKPDYITFSLFVQVP